MFPVAPNPNTSSMNWSSFALGVTAIIASVSYIWLRKTYLGAGGGENQHELFDMQMDDDESRYEPHLKAGTVSVFS